MSVVVHYIYIYIYGFKNFRCVTYHSVDRNSSLIIRCQWRPTFNWM